MDDRRRLLNLIESANGENRLCACGAPMAVTELDGALWLDCAERPARPEGLLSRIVSLDWLGAHQRRLLLSAEELRAA